MPTSRRIPPALEELLRSFGREISEVVNTAVSEAIYTAVDDGLARVENKVQDGLGRIRKARGRAQSRKRNK